MLFQNTYPGEKIKKSLPDHSDRLKLTPMKTLQKLQFN